jgi:hypothetical protein
VGANASLTQGGDDAPEVWRHILKDERKADQPWALIRHARQQRRGIGGIGDDADFMSGRVDRRHQIAEAKIVLILESDQERGLRLTADEVWNGALAGDRTEAANGWRRLGSYLDHLACFN